MDSKTKPIKHHLNVKRINENEIENYSVLFKSGDDLRKDFYVMQSLKLMSKVRLINHFYAKLRVNFIQYLDY
jgi:phosphatidylinositol kinase/protein kinase (PI-3  family)